MDLALEEQSVLWIIFHKKKKKLKDFICRRNVVRKWILHARINTCTLSAVGMGILGISFCIRCTATFYPGDNLCPNNWETRPVSFSFRSRPRPHTLAELFSRSGLPSVYRWFLYSFKIKWKKKKNAWNFFFLSPE